MDIHDMVRMALALARKGVTYKKKALCPLCGVKMRTVSSGKDEASRVRWHKCRNEECLIGSMALLVKSVE